MDWNEIKITNWPNWDSDNDYTHVTVRTWHIDNTEATRDINDLKKFKKYIKNFKKFKKMRNWHVVHP